MAFPATLALFPILATALAAMERTPAIIAAIVVVLVVIIAWKFLKLAFKIALVVVAGAAIFWVLRQAAII